MVEMEFTLVCPGRSFRDALSYLETGVIGVLTRQCLLTKEGAFFGPAALYSRGSV